MKLKALPDVSFEEEADMLGEEMMYSVADHLTVKPERFVEVKSDVVHSVEELEMVNNFRTKLLEEFQGTSLSGIYPKDPPVRGPFGEAEIWLKKDARLVSMSPTRYMGNVELRSIS